MKEPAMTSPFSAMNSREQKEQWICWQCAHGTGTPAAAKPTACTEKPTDSRFYAKSHHGQYNAVIRRLQSAGQRAGRYTSCTAEVSSVRQEASGSEHAEK